jgi:hypothetical protein
MFQIMRILACGGGVACWLGFATGLAGALPGVLAMGFLVAMKISLPEIGPRLFCHATPTQRARENLIYLVESSSHPTTSGQTGKNFKSKRSSSTE